MKLIVGLGNPGEKYKLNRHNVGFLAVDSLTTKFSKIDLQPNTDWNLSKNANALYLSFKIDNEKVVLIKPQTYMNKSGSSVSYAVRKHKIPTNEIFVIHDDLDIKLGDYKIIKGKGPREHNGLLDIYEKLGTKDFWHVRVGVDNRERMENGKWKMENFIKGEDYVLMNFSPEEMVIVEKVVDEVSDRLIELVGES